MLSVMSSKHKFMFESINKCSWKMLQSLRNIVQKYLLLIIIIIDDLYNRRTFS